MSSTVWDSQAAFIGTQTYSFPFEGLEEGVSSQESYDLQKAAELWEASAELVKLQDGETILGVKDAVDEAS
jgi:hypothetical protein